MRRITTSAAAAGLMLAIGLSLGTAEKKDSPKPKKPAFNATCPVMGNPAIRDVSITYRGKTLYFCCPGCPDQFDATQAEMKAKANFQLLQTGQIAQVACPLAGHDLNPEVSVTVNGQKVMLCCPDCRKRMMKLSANKRFAALFTDIDKGFTLQTHCPVTGKPIDRDVSLEHQKRRVYFYDKTALQTFRREPKRYLSKLPQFKKPSK